MKAFSKIRSPFRIGHIKRILKSKWVIVFFGPLFTLLGVAFVIWMGHLLTTHPKICLSCHARQSSVPMWAPSKVHPSRVGCADCHAKPNALFPRYFFADERVNENCLFCHKTVAQKEMETAHHIKIPHKLHIEESKLQCMDCHRNIAHEKIEAGTNRPRKLTCVECHEEALAGGPDECMKCHVKIPVASSS